MNRWLSLLLLAASLTSLNAQPVEDPSHRELRKLKATMEKALNDRDLDTLVANVDPNVVFTTMNGDVCRGPQEIRAYFHKMLTAPGHIVKNVTVSFEVDQLTSLYGGDTGVAYGSSNDHYELTNGDTFDIRGRWTSTMVRSGDRWVIAAFHYSANVFENPILDRLKQIMWMIGGASLLVGLLVGYFAGRILTRRRTAA